jgi:hypothetical protein
MIAIDGKYPTMLDRSQIIQYFNISYAEHVAFFTELINDGVLQNLAYLDIDSNDRVSGTRFYCNTMENAQEVLRRYADISRPWCMKTWWEGIGQPLTPTVLEVDFDTEYNTVLLVNGSNEFLEMTWPIEYFQG